MATPTFVGEYETSWTVTGSGASKTVDVTVAAGDVLVVLAVAEDSAHTLGTPTGGGLTYTLRQNSNVANNCNVYAWTASASGGQTFTMSITKGSGTASWGYNVLQWSSNDGVGASSKTNGSGGPSLGLTTTADNSAIAVAVGDWNATDGTTRTWRSVNGSAATEQTYFRNSSAYTVYAGYHADAGATGAKTVGLSAPTGQTYSIVAVEIKGSASAAQPPPRPALVVPGLAAIQGSTW
jgi:hypothetical protein